MNVYGELTKAQLENLTADPTLSSVRKGRIWYRTDLTAAFVDTGGTAQRFPWELFSRTANPAASGIVRFAKTDTLAWRNNANGADLALGIDASDNLSYNSHAFLSSAGVVPIAAGGTNVTSYTQGDLLYCSAANVLSKLGIGTPNQLLRTNAGGTLPEWATITASYTAPTSQTFLVTGTTTGYMFTVTAANATAGATYTNNGNTYTVLGTIAAGTQLFCSQAAAPLASGTLTKASGTGDATITFSANTLLATYTKPANVLYIKVTMVGGGGGGAAVNTNNGTAGTLSAFGANLLIANGGTEGINNSGLGGVGGTASVSSPATKLWAVSGSDGGHGQSLSAVTVELSGGDGGCSYFGGAGAGGGDSNGIAAKTNSGSGGGGGATVSANTGGGGGSGGALQAIIANPSASYPYIVGAKGVGGTAGGHAGGAGGEGQIIVEEFYQ